MPAGVSAYVPLANVTLAANTASVTFSSISQTHRDLVLVVSGTMTGDQFILCYLNGDGGNNYNYIVATGNGSAPGQNSASFTSPLVMGGNTTTGTGEILNSVLQIMDYSATDKHKNTYLRYNSPSRETSMRFTRWASTAAVSSITIAGNTISFAAGTTFALYGVSA